MLPFKVTSSCPASSLKSKERLFHPSLGLEPDPFPLLEACLDCISQAVMHSPACLLPFLHTNPRGMEVKLLSSLLERQTWQMAVGDTPKSAAQPCFQDWHVQMAASEQNTLESGLGTWCQCALRYLMAGIGICPTAL